MPARTYARGALLSALAASALAGPVDIIPRADCPVIHVFGARETTAPPGYGSSSTVVNGILSAFPGSTSEAIVYPACGGQSSCGGASYGSSVATGTTAVCNAIKSFAASCPSTQLVIVGYSQGGEIFDNALCGNGDPNQGISSTCSIASYNIKAAIFMGDPRYEYGIPYGVGTCKAGGFDARPAGQSCGSYNGLIQSYCDSADPYCCNGNDANVHQGYGSEYGQQAIAFVKSKLSANGGSSPSSTKTSSTPASSPTGGTGGTSTEYGQCGGIGYTGPTKCPSGWTCKAANAYYSQCLQ